MWHRSRAISVGPHDDLETHIISLNVSIKQQLIGILAECKLKFAHEMYKIDIS